MCTVDITGHDKGKIFENKTFNADKSMKEVVHKNSYMYVVIYTSMTNHI